MTALWKVDTARPHSTPFEAGARFDVIVVGAGVTGLSTALMLVRAGRSVAVIESGEVAELATGSNTGKLSLLQGTVLSTLRRHHSAALVEAYVGANRAGADWLAGFAEHAAVPFTRRTAYSYAQSSMGVNAVEEEFDAARAAGLAVRRLGDGIDSAELGDAAFPVAAAVALDDQVALDPQQLALALAREFVTAGGALHTHTRVTRVRALKDPGVETAAGPAFADRVVLATGTPIADRGLYFAKTHGLRSYCVSFRTESVVPEGMFLSVDGPTRSIRAVTTSDGPTAALVVGGNGHAVGRGGSERARIDDLIAWTRRHYPDAVETHRWSAQDYESHNLVPFVGTMPRSLGRVSFATGYAKWGLSNGPAAALRLSAEILGTARSERPAWMVKIGTRMTVPADLARGATENARVGAAAVQGWLDAERTPVPVHTPAEGQGVVAHRAGHPVGVSTVEGTTRAVSAVCPHLGGVLAWNDAECTWDCPLHASRFTAEGTRLEGPAVHDLRTLAGPTSGALGHQ